MNCIKPNVHAKKYQPVEYKGFVLQPHPNAASARIWGVRRPRATAMCAGPYATEADAKAWVDAKIAADLCPASDALVIAAIEAGLRAVDASGLTPARTIKLALETAGLRVMVVK